MHKSLLPIAFSIIAALTVSPLVQAQEPASKIVPARPAQTSGSREISGVYPHLASFNNESECGTGAVVPWAGRLWVVTYAPHMPKGSSDKLYEIANDLTMTVRPESIGGTPANRMIHSESKQLFIGPYAIDDAGAVRVIPYSRMYGRPTGNARHLTDPAGKIYLATMEEGLYEVDVKTLAVKELWRDEQLDGGRKSNLPGYHGKGLYSGQGRIVYANNGEHGSAAQSRPDVPSGALATWDGEADAWSIVRRNQFTEVTGPGGIAGNQRPESDPVWSIGWDHRSLILMTLTRGEWSSRRLPKSSHSYDGAHGWNTEWPRIRDIGEEDLLMSMHGQFWRFPKRFGEASTAGIRPRSSYLKIVGDFCRWQDRIVLGCDDAAKAEFLNTRRAKGEVAGPAYSQSNLWFLKPEQLDALGPVRGRGAVWLEDPVQANAPSDAYLFAGFEQRGVHLSHDAKRPVTFRFEVDAKGDGVWTPLREETVPANGYAWIAFDRETPGEWIRVTTDAACQATAWFEYRGEEAPATDPTLFQSLAKVEDLDAVGGRIRAGDPMTGLQALASHVTAEGSESTGYYEMMHDLSFSYVDSAEKTQFMEGKVAIPQGILKIAGSSVLYVDDDGKRYRLPIGNEAYQENPLLFDLQRTSREATTERDLFQAAGTFFELPARNAGGMAKIMPIATHPYFVQDYCSWRGMLAMTGIRRRIAGEPSDPHVVRSADGAAAVWLGTIDDLWKLGKPTGVGGPWSNSKVEAGEPSDPYLMAGYDSKRLTLSHDVSQAVEFDVQVDVAGTGLWKTYATLSVPAGGEATHAFPEGFQAYWVRLIPRTATTATATFEYE
jgi:hypothetical protein